MNRNKNKYSAVILLLPLAMILLYACASPGTPSGGRRDENPPRYLRSNPGMGSTNVDRNKIYIDFDEIVNVKDAFNKVVISPTSSKTPRVSSLGRRIIVDFQDTLMPNTTYSIDFGNSIEDNNEGNKLQGFSYYFSTGPDIDTLQISGMVLHARTLEPQQGMVVGVHSLVDDTTFQRKRLERVAKTDDRGRFTIRGLKEGKYRVFALGDLNNDYRWDNPEEDIAFFDYDVVPTFEFVTTMDTTWNLRTGAVDTITERQRTRFLPNDILLNSFNIDYKSQYLVKYERPDSVRLSFIFNAKSDTLPTLSVVGHDLKKPWYRLERSQHNDTLTYWLIDPALIAADTLRIAANYQRTDTAKMLVFGTDTLRMLRPKVKPAKGDKEESKKKKKKKQEEVEDTVPKVIPTPHLDMNILAGGSQEVYAPIYIEFPEPVATLDPEAFHLSEKVDTVWTPVRDGTMRIARADSLTERKYRLTYPWEYGKEYQLKVDTIAATGIYGLHTEPKTQTIKVKKEEEYCSLKLMITGLNDTIPAFVELLNAQDSPVRKVVVENGVAYLSNLIPGTYYARLVEDINGNAEYDTGSYDEGRQPEFTFYYPKALKLKANWDVEQSWNVVETALDLQKPTAIKKNKPERNKNQRQEKTSTEDEEDDYFDVSKNPFDPNSGQRRRR